MTEYGPHGRSTQQQPVTAVDLSFDEVANLFPFPIAEAAATLGVSTNDLKRVCRENGLNRWPYRKILAGKTVEDIKKEAAREMVILERMARSQPQSAANTSNVVQANRPGALNLATSAVPDNRLSTGLLQRQAAGPVHGLYAHASSLKPLYMDSRPQLQNQFHLRVNIPTYLDEFRHGFPNKGLSSVSTNWWGSALSDKAEEVDKSRGDMDMQPSVDQLEGGSDEQSGKPMGSTDSMDDAQDIKKDPSDLEDSLPASILTRTRRSAMDLGRKALGVAVTGGHGAYRVADKDEALLRAIFAEHYPSLWMVDRKG